MSLCPEAGKAPVVFTGKVAWVDDKEREKKVGVEIIEMDADQKNSILQKAYKVWLDEEKKRIDGLS